MCGMFATVYVDESIVLPHFPEELNRERAWQSKQGLNVSDVPYRITAAGRLEKKEQTYREKTDEEKQAEAEKWGYDSWGEYVQAYKEVEDSPFPEGIDLDTGEDEGEDTPPILFPREQTLNEQWWADQSFHGTFEFHGLLKENPISYETFKNASGETVKSPDEYALEVYVEYEARFSKGNLQEILFMGSRGFGVDDPIEHALEQIEQWREMDS